MTELIVSELVRFSSRRLFRLVGALAVVGVVAAAVISLVQTSKDPDAGRDAARREVAACEQQRRVIIAEHGAEADFPCPTVEELAPQLDKSFHYRRSIPDASRGVAVALFVLAFVVGASFVGAEWGSGAMTTLLTWESRRGRVLIAKVLAAMVLTALSAAIVLALIAAVYLPVGALRGTSGGPTRSTWWTLSGIWLRGGLLAAFGAAVAGGIATFARNTAAAIGVAFAYGVFVDPLLGIYRDGTLVPWLLQHNIPRLLGFADVPQPRTDELIVGDPSVLQPMQLSITRPVILFTIYAAAILAIAYAAFRARDVN